MVDVQVLEEQNHDLHRLLALATVGELVGRRSDEFSALLNSQKPFGGGSEDNCYIFALPVKPNSRLPEGEFPNGKRYVVPPSLLIRVNLETQCFDRCQMGKPNSDGKN